MTEEDIRQALHEVIDPEIGINVVDLGLIYGIKVQGSAVTVQMTMTSAACPMGDMMQADAEAAIRGAFPEAKEVNVALVWDPPWEPALMSDTARQILGWS